MLLGQRLVETGIVTVENVQSALEAQLVLGGRLGTHLLKKGFVDIDTLSMSLARHVGAPAAKLKHFEQIDPLTAASIPVELAVKHKAIPLAMVVRGQKELLVAFRDPTNTAAVEEIAIVSGARVRLFVAPELCIYRYLERYYGVRPELEMAPLVPSPRASSRPRPNGNIVRPEAPTLDPSRRDATRERPTPEPRTPSLEDLMRAAEWLPSLPNTGGAVLPSSPLEAAMLRIERAENKDEIGEAIADYLRSMAGVGIVFIVRDDVAFGWCGFGPDLDAHAIESIAFPLNAKSVLSTSYNQNALFRGPPNQTQGVLQAHFFNLLHTEPPLDIIVAPIFVKDRVVNLVYAQSVGSKRLPEATSSEIMRLCEAAADAFVRVIKQQKVTTIPPIRVR
jgi:hypothetical protein